MADKFAIRDAMEEDVDVILDFIRRLAEYERLADRVVATTDGLREVLFGSRRYAEVLIGEEDGVPVGFALYFHNFSTFAGRPGIYLEDLFVLDEHRGKGYGKALLTALARIAVERNCSRLEWSVLDWNEPAIGFYKSLGAVPMDEWTVFRVSGDALERLGRS
jgi:GNAT superfamily N-acetyltransferase